MSLNFVSLICVICVDCERSKSGVPRYGLIAQHCTHTPGGLHCSPSLGVTYFLWGSQCLVEIVRVMSSLRDVIEGVTSLCAALLNDIYDL